MGGKRGYFIDFIGDWLLTRRAAIDNIRRSSLGSLGI
jgi:hypothetical protein